MKITMADMREQVDWFAAENERLTLAAERYEMLKRLVEYTTSGGDQILFASWNFGPLSLLPATLDEALDEMIREGVRHRGKRL